MEQILVYSDRIKIRKENGRIAKYAVTRNDLAYLLVNEKDADCLLMEFQDPDQTDIEFIASVRQNFPMLDTALIVPEKSMRNTDGYTFGMLSVLNPESATLENDIEKFINTSKSINKRSGNRFCWPLTADYSANGSTHEKLEIYSISSSGAFLKSTRFNPPPGENGFITINFKESLLKTGCTVNDYSSRPSNYPVGFSLVFTSLSDEEKKTIDRLVDDAIVKILLDPHAKPAVPTLGPDTLTDGFSL